MGDGQLEAVAPDESHFYRMALEQDGDRITGRACGINITVRDQLAIAFLDVAVTGSDTTVTFTTPSGARFTGRHDADPEEIAGTFGTTPADTISLRFTRVQFGDCVLTR